jgi:hypothetical protein
MSEARAETPEAQEARRQAGARLVHAIYRLVKASLIHNDANQTVAALVTSAHAAVAEFCSLRETDAARILFSRDVVFINRRIMKGSRETSALGVELGGLIEATGANEILIEKTVIRAAIASFARLVADVQRDRSAARRLLDGSIPGISARKTEIDEAALLLDQTETGVTRIVRGYAASILILKSFYEDVENGRIAGSRVKRIAQKLVALGEEGPELLVALAAGRFGDAEPARVAVSTAVIAAAMARRLTEEPTVLASIVGAALLLDAGRARLGGFPSEERLPGSTLLVLTAIGKFSPAQIARSVIAYEACRLDRCRLESPLHRDGAPATELAVLLHVARSFNHVRTPAEGAPAAGIDDAIEILSAGASTDLERAHVRLLIGALGFYPIGALVELDTREVAVVMGAPALSIDFARPKVRILCDASGRLLSAPMDRNLAERPPSGEPKRAVTRAIPLDAEKAETLRSLV